VVRFHGPIRCAHRDDHHTLTKRPTTRNSANWHSPLFPCEFCGLRFGGDFEKAASMKFSRLGAAHGSTPVVLAALTAISVIPGFSGGHPPAIFMVFILGVFAGIGVLVIAALMLAMQLVDLARAAFR
jgi:hypothetical protein